MLIEKLRPDVTMVPDNYTYVDNPLFLPWSQTLSVIRKKFNSRLKNGMNKGQWPSLVKAPG